MPILCHDSNISRQAIAKMLPMWPAKDNGVEKGTGERGNEGRKVQNVKFSMSLS